jgi:hypothetical protein
MPAPLVRCGALVLLIVGAASVALGCGASPEAPAGPSARGTGTTFAAPATTSRSPEQEVEAAYHRFWEVFVAANDPPNPDDPRLEEVATGPMLQKMRSSARQDASEGLALQHSSPPQLAIEVQHLEIHGDTATLRACVKDGIQVVRSSDGSVVDGDVVTHIATGTFERSDGRWRLREHHFPENESESEPCEIG